MTTRQKYKVVRRLDAGGMAEVFVGESETIEGFKKMVAIKRVLPHLAENKKFLAMFLDEARISLGFNHANVVQTFDIGRADQTYFIVMEYVDGTNLKQVTEHLRENRRIMPVEIAVYIVSEVCRGLAYAHKLTDGKGRTLGIVHRDVSPPNILLSKEGEVKIVDFGLAKATTQLERTDPGVVKGKFAYLAPETAAGEQVDLRADIFACGILLFELLTGKRLFLGDTDVETIRLVRAAKVPSVSAINGQVPSSLEAIIRKALARSPEDRFSGCGEMAESLSGFLFEYGRKVTSLDVSRLVSEVAVQTAREPVADLSLIDQLIQEEMMRFSSIEDEGSGFLRLENGRPSYGAAPLDPSGFGDMRRLSTPPAVPGPEDASSALWSDTGSPSLNPGDPLLAAPPTLEHLLEGEVHHPTPPLSMPPPAGATQTKLFFLAVLAAAAAAGITIIAAYSLGWFP